MALEGVVLNLGAGGDSIGTDNVGGLNYEVVKQAFGAEGSIELVEDANPLPTKEYSGTGTSSTANITNVSSTALASNSNRRGATFQNEGTATVYLKLGATASTTSYTVQIREGSYYEVPYGYVGIIDAITSASTATLRVTELT